MMKSINITKMDGITYVIEIKTDPIETKTYIKSLDNEIERLSIKDGDKYKCDEINKLNVKSQQRHLQMEIVKEIGYSISDYDLMDVDNNEKYNIPDANYLAENLILIVLDEDSKIKEKLKIEDYIVVDTKDLVFKEKQELTLIRLIENNKYLPNYKIFYLFHQNYHDVIKTISNVKRTPKFLVFHLDGKKTKRKIKNYNGIEYITMDGSRWIVKIDYEWICDLMLLVRV